MKQVFTFLLFICPHLLMAQTGTVKLLNASGVEVSSHASITEAYAALPQPLTQAYTIELQNGYLGTSETVPLVLGAKAGASASNTITVRPATGFSGVTLTAAVSSGSLLSLDDADYVILDGRPGGQGNTGVITLNNTATNGNTIGLINGATYNVIRYLNLQNNGTGSASRTIGILTSATNTDGNSYNRFEYNIHIGSRYGINSNGTAANPNRKNEVFGNSFSSVIFSAIWCQAGTSGITIDSNSISSTNSPSNTTAFGILFDSQTDTVIIRNNRIFDLNVSGSSAVRGISIRSTLAAGTDNYSEVYNNFISLALTHGSTSVAGIEFGGVNLTNANVWHNSIYIGGNQTNAGTSGNVFSAAVLEAGVDAGASSYQFRNNLFLNQRTGGNSGGFHVGLATTSQASLFSSDYNIYNTTANLARIAGTLCANLADLRSTLSAPNELNTDTIAVQFVSTTDLHLSGSSLGNIQLAGTPLAQVTTDIDGDFRSSVPYRGADEAVPSLGGSNACSGTPTAGSIQASSSLYCTGNPPILLTLNGQSSDLGISINWKVSIDSLLFVDIAGANADSLLVSPAQKSWYKAIINCIPSGLSDSTNVIAVDQSQRPAIGSLTFTNNQRTYTFNLSNSARVDSFIWNFGDGSPEIVTVVPTATHTYANSGAFSLAVSALNSCGADSVRLNFNITVSIENNSINDLKLYPNPFENQLNISTENALKSLRITDMQGREIQSVYPMVSDYSWSLAHLPQGQYLIEIVDIFDRRSIKTLLKTTP